MHLCLEARAQPHQLRAIADQLAQLPDRRRRDPRLRQPTQPQHVGEVPLHRISSVRLPCHSDGQPLTRARPNRCARVDGPLPTVAAVRAGYVCGSCMLGRRPRGRATLGLIPERGGQQCRRGHHTNGTAGCLQATQPAPFCRRRRRPSLTASTSPHSGGSRARGPCNRGIRDLASSTRSLLWSSRERGSRHHTRTNACACHPAVRPLRRCSRS
jgi:hypothetical protein